MTFFLFETVSFDSMQVPKKLSTFRLCLDVMPYEAFNKDFISTVSSSYEFVAFNVTAC